LVECLAVVAALALLACVAVPVLAGTKSDSQRIFCVNNLRQIGQAWAGWKNEHNDQMPQHVEYNQGGMKNNPLKQNAWVHYSMLSNNLPTPKPIACPSDTGVRPALDWLGGPGTGFYQPPGLGDAAVSYSMGLHGFAEYPLEMVGSDRFFDPTPAFDNCITGVRAMGIPDFGNSGTWNASIGHVGLGNLLLNDGQVLQTTSCGFQTYLKRPGKFNDAGHEHFLVPNR
jgi:hypothetical protein